MKFARNLLAYCRKVWQAQDGASLVEYSLALMLIAIVTIAMVSLLGTSISNFFTFAAGTI